MLQSSVGNRLDRIVCLDDAVDASMAYLRLVLGASVQFGYGSNQVGLVSLGTFGEHQPLFETSMGCIHPKSEFKIVDADPLQVIDEPNPRGQLFFRFPQQDWQTTELAAQVFPNGTIEVLGTIKAIRG